MKTHRWLNQSHPRNLQNATVLMYMNAVLALLFGVLGGGLHSAVGIVTLAGAAGAYGIANDKKWGYWLSCAVAVWGIGTDVLLVVDYKTAVLTLDFFIGVLFHLLLLFLLFEKGSREYSRMWFK